MTEGKAFGTTAGDFPERQQAPPEDDRAETGSKFEYRMNDG
jgi:hypothetical protein